MSVAVVFKSPYVKGGKAAGKAGYIARRIGVDKSINNKVVINANYIATRPKVEKFGTHGLFSNKTDLNLNEVLEELKELKCNVWLPMLSLTREDATRFGYDNARAWQTLIQSKQADIAKIYKIPLDDLRLFPPSKNGHRKATKNGMNRSLSFVFERRPHLFHGSLAGDLCRHDIPAKGRNSPEGDSPQHKPIISATHCQATHLP